MAKRTVTFHDETTCKTCGGKRVYEELSLAGAQYTDDFDEFGGRAIESHTYVDYVEWCEGPCEYVDCGPLIGY